MERRSFASPAGEMGFSTTAQDYVAKTSQGPIPRSFSISSAILTKQKFETKFFLFAISLYSIF